MRLGNPLHYKTFMYSAAAVNIRAALIQRSYSNKVYEKYDNVQKEKILQVLNESPVETFSEYNLTKATIKNLSKWKVSNTQLKTLPEVEYIEGFTPRSAKKLFDGILEGPKAEKKVANKIKGQVLHPALDESVKLKCKTVLTVYIAVNSVSWACINRDNYEVVDWNYHQLNFRDSKKMQITDIFDISWSITRSLPQADIYVMKAEATSLRAAGSDPNNPKVISVNLQKSQMVAMIVALINARFNANSDSEELEDTKTSLAKQRVYFLRPTLPYRLYGTLVGNEKVSTDQVVEMILQDSKQNTSQNNQFYISEELKSKFRGSNELQKDMLGHCLLLGLTFMDVCIYANQEKIQKLNKRID